MKDFVTLDFGLAAKLMCKGYELSCIKKYGYFIIYLKNHDDIELQRLIKQNWNSKLKVDNQTFDRNYNRLITLAKVINKSNPL